MSRFRKKLVVIEAVRWDGKDAGTVISWRNHHSRDVIHSWRFQEDGVLIPTLEGEMRASPGDWIIMGVNKEFYPCKPDIFAATYEPVE